jgi:hypothetical protein
MILRRVIAHFKKQEWTAIAIDFLIVVGGVFIGIQVSNWNAARKDESDARLFLLRLHEDIEQTNMLSARLIDRRLGYPDRLRAVSDILFERSAVTELDAEGCRMIGSSHYYNINTGNLPSIMELISSGRMTIIKDANLRTALVSLQQTEAGLAGYVNTQIASVVDIPSKYPDLFKLTVSFDPNDGEARVTTQCDTNVLRADQGFMNDFSQNVDRFDAFVRDGLAPWKSQFDVVHALVDEVLDLHHGDEAAK